MGQTIRVTLRGGDIDYADVHGVGPRVGDVLCSYQFDPNDMPAPIVFAKGSEAAIIECDGYYLVAQSDILRCDPSERERIYRQLVDASWENP